MLEPRKDPAPKQEDEALIPVHSAENAEVRASFSTSADRLKLFLTCDLKTPGTRVPISRVGLLELFPEGVPGKLLHVDVLDDIAEKLSRGQSVPQRRVARGSLPVPSRDGRLVLLVKTYNKKSGAAELVDPWFMKMFDNIETGMSVARIYPPKEGAPGSDVFGEDLKAEPGKEISVQFDESLLLQPSDDKSYSVLVAQTSGYLAADQEKLHVVHDLVLSGDVDPHSGDLNFVGNVVVKGNVKKNFRVSARENIEIHGYVQDAWLSSAQGNITVNGHVSGEVNSAVTLSENIPFQQLLRMVENRRPQITCAGTFKATVLDRVMLEALGDIEIEKEARSCFLRTRATLRMPKGNLIGGEVHTVCGVEAATLGSALGTETKITLCSDTESSAEYGALIEKLRAHDSAEEMVKLYLGPYAENPARISLLQPALRSKMEKLKKKLDELERSKQELLLEKEELMRMAKHNIVYRINVLKVAHAGVVIVAGEDTYRVDEDLLGPKTIEYFPKEKRFAVGDLQPLQCVLESQS